jgi:hypothetical protein
MSRNRPARAEALSLVKLDLRFSGFSSLERSITDEAL